MEKVARTRTNRADSVEEVPTSSRKSARGAEGGSSLLRMLSVFELFTIEEPRWSVEEISAKLNLTQSTAYRYVSALCSCGLLAAFGGAQYSLGPKIIELDLSIRQTDPLIGMAEKFAPGLLELVPKGVVSLISIRGDTAISVFQLKKPANLNLSFERGRSMSLFSGSAAKVILAHLPRARQLKLFGQFAPDIARVGLGQTWKEFARHLLEIRRQDVMMTKGELVAESWGIAAPIFNADGDVTSSINLIMPLKSFSEKRCDLLRSEVARVAGEMNSQLRDVAGRPKKER